MPQYLCLAHGHHNSVCTTIKRTFDPPWFNCRDAHNRGGACRRSGIDLEVHLVVIDVAMLAVDEDPLRRYKISSFTDVLAETSDRSC